MSPEDFELFRMQWESYRDSTLVPNLYTPESTSMELWQCCGNTLQANLLNNSMTNTTSETELLSKLKDITIKAPSYPVNRLNFMEMKQGAAVTSQQWLSRLKDKARHCNFNVPTGQTSYMDQRVKDTFIFGLPDSSIKSDIMEKSALSEAQGRELFKNCNNSRQDHGPTREERQQKCPAFNRTCPNWKKVGHFGDKCRSKPKPPANNQAEAEPGANNQVVG